MEKEEQKLLEALLSFVMSCKTRGLEDSQIIDKLNNNVNKMIKTINETKEHLCCICGKEIIGFGNNPYPLKKEGRCCDDCNSLVIEARMNGVKNEKE